MLSELIDKAIDSGITFAVCVPPGMSPRFFVEGEACGVGAQFIITPWLTRWKHRIVIPKEISQDKFLELCEASNKITSSAPLTNIAQHDNSFTAADHEKYIAAVTKVIESCRAREGKTVFSRITEGRLAQGLMPGLIFADICGNYKDTFRFIFYTPQTGLWLGATPELLLSRDESGECSTMALAGTRKQMKNDICDSDSQKDRTQDDWDEKNIAENRFVTDFITETLSATGCTGINVGERCTLRYGQNIEHICHRISAKLSPTIPVEIVIDALNPTPALCGIPRDAAIADIQAYEPHQRECYGGTVGIEEPAKQRITLYVTLRCCKIVPKDKLLIYTGGGITAASNPEAEYTETEAKASTFLPYLAGKSC